MLYRNPVISGTNRLPVTLNPQQIKDMQVWCFMSYDNWMDNPDNWANMGIDVWAQVDTITRVEPVPEPATLLVLGPVLLSFAGFGKKLMKKNPS